jgi:hypothetical protein
LKIPNPNLPFVGLLDQQGEQGLVIQEGFGAHVGEEHQHGLRALKPNLNRVRLFYDIFCKSLTSY